MKDAHTGQKIEKYIITTASIILTYLLISLYFTTHYFFNTVINGVDVSLKSYKKAEAALDSFAENYELLIIERSGRTEGISGREIGLYYNREDRLPKVHQLQRPVAWAGLFFTNRRYFINKLFQYDEEELSSRIDSLRCLNSPVTEPKNVSFIYAEGSYVTVEGEQGSKIDENRLLFMIKMSIHSGKATLDLDKALCYENPKYTLASEKTYETRDKLNRYVSTTIAYRFGSQTEILDGSIIQGWLSVDDDLEVVIDKKAIMEYIKGLSRQYDTVGTIRSFQTSTGKIVEVKGGTYGWKINQRAEVKSLLESIYRGEQLEKEPVYSRKALYRNGNDIGDTFIEINITRQHMWFYKDGNLIADGPVVTGNPNRGNATVMGTYKVVYKDKKATLSGPGYEVEVTYWMPFYGNMGIHDARWRSSFGGEIYKTKGTHGCVNAPYQLAKAIFEKVEEGTPVVIYAEPAAISSMYLD